MLLFWSEEHVEKWCADWNLPRGEIIPLDKCWLLAQAWFSDRRETQWRRRTVEESESLLTGLGFTSPFWRLTS
jgi:hypothetical protein